MAKLTTIEGIGETYAQHLLEAAGVDTIPDLARRNGENLHAKMAEVNQEKELVRQLPSQAQVQSWIEQAQQLPRVVTY